MKKIACVLLVSAYLLNGCHSGTKTNDANKLATGADTARKHAATPQPIDTTIKDGLLIKRYPNGVIKERSTYLSGRRQGECQSFYPDGKMQSDDFFAGGLLEGSTTVYYNNGQKEYEGTCTKGKPSGIWKFYDNTGKLVRTKDYGIVKANPAI